MGFLDWLDDIGPGGGTSWETNYLDAVAQAKDWIDQVADAKGWSDAWRNTAYDIVASAEWNAGNQLGDTLTEAFWRELTEQWGNVSNPPDGWDKLGTVWDSASDAAYDPVEQAIDNVEQTIQDIVQDTKDLADPGKSPWPWIAGGVVALLLWGQFRR
jgi:hypothetical protein